MEDTEGDYIPVVKADFIFFSSMRNSAKSNGLIST